MHQKHQVHNLIILDESGSMHAIKSATIQGFNEILQTIKAVEQQFPDQEHFISLVSFNGIGRKTHLWREPVAKLVELDASTYSPDASTPLFDAMGWSMSKLAAELSEQPESNILVTIFTDGAENASREYTAAAIKQMVGELKAKRWTFTYIGTDHDVDKIAVSISITNVMRYKKNKEDMKKMFRMESSARMAYSRKINMKEDTSDNFYGEKE